MNFEPTHWLPKSSEKINVMMERAEARLPLFHKNDAVLTPKLEKLIRRIFNNKVAGNPATDRLKLWKESIYEATLLNKNIN